jgi:hypothetical protein
MDASHGKPIVTQWGVAGDAGSLRPARSVEQHHDVTPPERGTDVTLIQIVDRES